MCLNLIHRSALSVVSGEINLSTVQLEKLIFARKDTLGRYFEMLIGTLFRISPEIECTHTNVVVRDGKTTLGEFDLLYKKNGYWHHLELAIKFYLGTSDQTSSFNWHGPALRDTLAHKSTRMNDHQLKLPISDIGSEVLRNLSIRSVESEALMLGMLFHPFTDWISKSLVIPANVSRSHASGWWMYASKISNLSNISNFHYLPLMKLDWIAKTEMHSSPKRCDFKDIRQPKMVAVYKQIEHNRFCEIQRGFIVPDNWGPK